MSIEELKREIEELKARVDYLETKAINIVNDSELINQLKKALNLP